MPARIGVLLEAGRGAAGRPAVHTGPAVNAAFLAAVRDGGEAELATLFHEARPPKPYTLTPLLDERDRPARGVGERVRFEVGVLSDTLTAPVLLALSRLSRTRVANCHYSVAGIEVLRAEPYAELLDAARSVRRWTFDIRTPAAFFTAREEGVRRVRPFPTPEWVFSDLYRRWNAFGPPMDDETADAITGNLEAVEHRLVTSEHLLKAGAPTVRGCVGTISYRVVGQPGADAVLALDALVRFSAYAGIGDRTNIGMGHVHPTSP
ncbi:CRISPR-associated endoribonuclease Cas6 [Actinocorallia sp. API 0066]|uniref:CRISPR-associated endoribonuclease Cas6 n=1 Tax=Actinocorallia sp. API 0066 TaxID=2896846 RepID=UPI001E398C60|nr:CRISPR-associated endoribonuclease Cas6 [Actinocorallia sp. API 0066]MCD0449393.1 CRISPR-associated endoribonuclease Cas6 [Actinocorallia sp. API 0066]